MGFVNDLKIGEDYEAFITKQLYEKFGTAFEKNAEKRKVDLVHPLINAEVKFDRRMHETGNLFIEIGYKGNDSGLFKDDETDLFIYWNKSFAFIFKVSKLRKDLLEGIEDGKFKTIKAGDGWNSTGILLPITSAEDMCHYKLEFAETQEVIIH